MWFIVGIGRYGGVGAFRLQYSEERNGLFVQLYAGAEECVDSG